MSDQTTALARKDSWKEMDLAHPADLARVFSTSRLFTGVGDMAQAMVKILAGRDLGMGAFSSMQGIDIIKGKLRLTANTLASMVKLSERYDYRVKVWTDDECAVEFFQGSDSIGTSTFTMTDAKRAGLANKDNWKCYPRNMLWARAMSNGVNAFCPDVTKGIRAYTEGDDLSNGFHAEPSTKTSDLDAALDEPEDEEPGGGDARLDDYHDGKPKADLFGSPPNAAPWEDD